MYARPPTRMLRSLRPAIPRRAQRCTVPTCTGRGNSFGTSARAISFGLLFFIWSFRGGATKTRGRSLQSVASSISATEIRSPNYRRIRFLVDRSLFAVERVGCSASRVRSLVSGVRRRDSCRFDRKREGLKSASQQRQTAGSFSDFRTAERPCLRDTQHGSALGVRIVNVRPGGAMPKVKCAECGLFAIREFQGTDVLELVDDYRLHGRTPNQRGTQTKLYVGRPFCIERHFGTAPRVQQQRTRPRRNRPRCADRT